MSDGAAASAALAALEPFDPAERLEIAARRLAGDRRGPLAAFEVGSEDRPSPGSLDGRVLEAVASRALAGARGAVFTAPQEARLLAALGLAQVAARRGIDDGAALAALLRGERSPELARALDGASVVDPACGGGALLVAALALARRCGAEPRLSAIDVAPLAARATAARLALLRADARVSCADALAAPWPAADLVLSNPPFLRHERLAAPEKARAAARSGLPRQADLSAHFAAAALRHAREAALVWPRALDTARSAAPLLADARARGGFAFRLRSRASGSFAASVDTLLAVWSEGHRGRPDAEASVALAALRDEDLLAVARRTSTARVRLLPSRAPAPRGAARVGELCAVRFGMKSGCNAFFHLRPAAGGRFASPLAGEVRLAAGDAQPILSSLREAAAPALASPSRALFRPAAPGPEARDYIARGERLGVAARPTCAGRSPWWTVAPGRAPAPVLYPAKVGARAFAFLNAARLWEDKKWHALFPAPGIEPWVLAAVLSSTPVRLAIDAAARQLTGMQAIADVDCRVVAAAPCPAPAALAPALADLAEAWAALAADPVTTDVGSMLARPAQHAIDEAVGRALGLSAAGVARTRRDLAARVAARLEHAAHIRAELARAPGRGTK